MRGRAPLQDAAGDEAASEAAAEAPPAAAPPAAPEGDGDKIKPKAKPKDAGEPPVPKPLRDVRTAESLALKDYLTSLGTQGSVRIRVNRTDPKILRINGKEIKIEGHLDTVDEFLSEGDLAERWGGGTYDLTITTRGDQGSYQYAGHRIVKISGEPKAEAHVAPSPAPQASSGGDGQPALVREMVGLLKSELDQARKPDSIPPALQALLDQMRADLHESRRESAALRTELRDAQRKDPPTDPIKDKLLGTLIDGESGRIISLREQFASEMRQVKESHQADVKRLEDRHDRVVAEMRSERQRDLEIVKATFEREIAALKASHEVSLSAVKTTAELQRETLKNEIERLRGDLQSMRSERDTLRDKKDKPLLDQVKEIDALKELLGAGDADGGGTVGQLVAALPAVAETVGGIVAQARSGGVHAGQPVAQVGASPPQAQQRPRVVVNRQTGQRFVQNGTQMVPVRPKPKMVTNESGTPVEAPPVEPAQLALIINTMEQAFRRDESPEIVAQTGRTFVPREILAWIRENDTEASSGLELFMSRVANLSSTSPLASQGGRNWLRKVGKALIEGGG